MYLRYVSSLQFLTYLAFFAIFVGSISYMLPGRKPPIRTEPYMDDELRAHDRKLAKYFVAGGFFLVLGSLHMAVKNLPWVEEYLARTGHAGHLVRDLSSMGGTKKENVVICLESPRIRAAVADYIRINTPKFHANPELLYDIMAYELMYICYCDRSQRGFHDWLATKHGAIDRCYS